MLGDLIIDRPQLGCLKRSARDSRGRSEFRVRITVPGGNSFIAGNKVTKAAPCSAGGGVPGKGVAPLLNF